ncbi:MAG: DNA-nicking Smr family endonuclease [Halieaceae bacterium]|jgi:DNA-nicking Smr family endonuclease
MSDDDLFQTEMSGVEPLKRTPRATRSAAATAAEDASLAHRRQAAVASLAADGNPLREEGVEPLDHWFVLEFKRPGIQNGVYRKLKQGRYEMEARLDLHQMTVKQARNELFSFIQESHHLGLRSILLVHGKGQSRPDQERSSILKGCANQWLRELDVVQAFHSAQVRHGGTGAVYCLLRKSEEKKRENRERINKGRVPID